MQVLQDHIGSPIILKSGEYEDMYTHLEPKFMLEKGTFLRVGEIIAKVGPKYVEKSPYMDSRRKIYKWINNRTTSTFWSKISWKLY